jgi:hypothetical protein
MINLERSFNNILKNWGYDVYIQRKLANGNYSNDLERVTTRSVFPGGNTLAHSAQEEIEGVMIDSDVTYFFEGNVNPQEGDRVYENWPNDGNIQVFYTIDTSVPLRGRRGKIVYWRTGATRDK